MSGLPSAGAAGAASIGGKRGERLAKVIARAGLCSRRDAEAWIRLGRVAVNGAAVATPATVVTTGDIVTVDGTPLPAPAPPRMWRYHKPEGLVTTHRDPQGRPTVFGTLPAALGRVVSVGRLDIASEGLLLLTNDGELARRLELPATGWTRRYRVRAFGRIDDGDLRRLAEGMTVDGIRYGPVEAALDRQQGDNVWLTVALKEGKNREVRTLLAWLGLTVNRLIRIAFGPFQLGRLAKGEVDEIAAKVLREQLGTGLIPPRRRDRGGG
jgi:23S rRNA pseudouridine2605 synthase